MQVTSSLFAYATPNEVNHLGAQQDADSNASPDATSAHDNGRDAPQAPNPLTDMARESRPALAGESAGTAGKPSDSDPRVKSACKPVHNSQGVSPAVGYTLGQSGNAISAAGGTTQSIKHPPAPPRATGFLGSISRILGSVFGLGIGLADPEVAKGVANMNFDVEARKCFEAGKCDVEKWVELKKMYNDCPGDAWAELNRIKSQ
ncbi:hypothetical protein EII20_14075 [Comamonadaceae bacterium OH2545_COT-014]|nr:hypothetical protein EII20_14075 [Comamonadaceae bacterium OH2545_COT-014]